MWRVSDGIMKGSNIYSENDNNHKFITVQSANNVNHEMIQNKYTVTLTARDCCDPNNCFSGADNLCV